MGFQNHSIRGNEVQNYMCKEMETEMFEMKGVLLAWQHHPVPNGAEGDLFSKHSNIELFFLVHSLR